MKEFNQKRRIILKSGLGILSLLLVPFSIMKRGTDSLKMEERPQNFPQKKHISILLKHRGEFAGIKPKIGRI